MAEKVSDRDVIGKDDAISCRIRQQVCLEETAGVF